MPTKRILEFVHRLIRSQQRKSDYDDLYFGVQDLEYMLEREYTTGARSPRRTTTPKRKLSAWNKYVKANSKKPRFRYRNGKLNLKKMAVAFRKTKKRGSKR